MHENIIWATVSGTLHKGESPSPRPCRLSTSVPEGMGSHSNCHTNIFIFKGKGAFHMREGQEMVGDWHKAWYTEFTENSPVGESR